MHVFVVTRSFLHCILQKKVNNRFSLRGQKWIIAYFSIFQERKKTNFILQKISLRTIIRKKIKLNPLCTRISLKLELSALYNRVIIA